MDEMIFQVMLVLPESKLDLDERLAHAKTSLRKLALLSIRTPGRQLFERFCAFQIRQSLIALV
ncbi:hypothetical protein [Pedobacter agri]|uniref:hypothetical protein n=1 Tax=Pedobacter agri TaxID=454586 RepID=UPI002931941D|nr:hypothetical protein [Pedobacter agri]